MIKILVWSHCHNKEKSSLTSLESCFPFFIQCTNSSWFFLSEGCLNACYPSVYKVPVALGLLLNHLLRHKLVAIGCVLYFNYIKHYIMHLNVVTIIIFWKYKGDCQGNFYTVQRHTRMQLLITNIFKDIYLTDPV